ncbi:MAG: erythromycin esterase family protein [Flavobacteriaceae bacterium]|nr:erythromycin esterase family protein [Flavobacteriaceae bacterium]
MKHTLFLSILLATTILNAQVVKQINKDKTDLDFTNEITLSNSLNHLIKKVKSKKIVAIGEDTHGTSEYYKLRFEITKKLITEKGFNTIILENPYGDIEVLVTNIQKENLDSLMTKHLLSIYQTKEMKAFLLWFKEYSATHKDIRFKGCDDSYGQMSQLLINELPDKTSKDLTDLLIDFNNIYTLSKELYFINKNQKMPEGFSDTDYGIKAYSTILGIEKQIETENLQTPKIEEYLFNLKNTFVNYKNLTEGGIQSRDEIMADRITYIANKPKAKVIVWAHNAHISKTIIIDNEIGMMGEILKNEYEDNYYAIGLSTNEGTYSFIENKFINDNRIYNDELLQDAFVFTKTNSWEQLFSEVESDAYYFEFNKYSRIRFKNSMAKYLKLVGYNIESDKDYYLLSPQEMFDAIIFIKETTATIPLFGEAKPKRERLDLVDLRKSPIIPEKWTCGGVSEAFIMRVDSTQAYSGNKSIYIESYDNSLIKRVGTCRKGISVDNYLGKQIKLSGYIKSENITGWAGFWMRVDGKNNKVLSFDNMNDGLFDRSIKGTTDWTKYEIILKVPKKATHITFGVLLADGSGKLWFDDVTIEAVSKDSNEQDLKTVFYDFEN